MAVVALLISVGAAFYGLADPDGGVGQPQRTSAALAVSFTYDAPVAATTLLLNSRVDTLDSEYTSGEGSRSAASAAMARRAAQGADEAVGGVYSLRDEAGSVVRTGRTKELARRRGEHARDPELGQYRFRSEYRTDDYTTQRGLEQLLHDEWMPPLNGIRPISPRNRRIDELPAGGAGVPRRTVMARKVPYSEGDVFAVPLRDGGYALGVVGRMDGKGSVLGYFFGHRYDEVPDLAHVGELNAVDNVLVQIFGDLGLIRGKWPVLGRLRVWRPEEWPMPAFGRHEELTGRYLRVEYADDDPNSRPREVEVPREEYQHLPEDGLAGFGFTEARLTRLLAASPPREAHE